MLSLHLVLVTLHGWFTISIEQDEIESVTLNTLLHVPCIMITIRFDCSKSEMDESRS